MRIGSLCSGAGALDLAVMDTFNADVAWHCEVDPAASSVLEHRFPDAPNHGDLTAMDWASVEPVDIIAAGWPCQPWSAAGSRKGAEDERAIWPSVARAIRDLRPRWVVLENVARIVAVGELARAVGDLSAAGYDSRWVCVRASDAGAPHGRRRCFVAAYSTDHGHERAGASRSGRDGSADRSEPASDTQRAVVRKQPGRISGTGGEGAPVAGNDGQGAALADTSSDGRDEGRAEPAGVIGGSDAALCGGPVASHPSSGSAAHQQECGDPGGQPLSTVPRAGTRDSAGRTPTGVGELGGSSSVLEWGAYAGAIHRWEGISGRRAPAPTVPGRTGKPQLNPQFSEWLMGWPAGWVTDVPDLSRSQQLHIIGNGVVPQQALLALSWLLSEGMS